MKYISYLKDAEQFARQKNEEYAAKQRADLAQYAASLQQATQQSLAAKRQETAREIDKQDAVLADTLDRNAVERYIEQRNIEERVANLGLAGSGSEAAQKQAATAKHTVRNTAARRTHAQKVGALQDAYDRVAAGEQTALDKQIAAKRADYENRISNHLQTLLKKATTEATDLYRSDNTIENWKLGLGDQGEITIENLRSEKFRNTIDQRLRDGEDPEFLLKAFRKTLKYTHLSPLRIILFLQSLSIPEEYQQFLALSIDRDMYAQYWEAGKKYAAKQSLTAMNKPGDERKGLHVK